MSDAMKAAAACGLGALGGSLFSPAGAVAGCVLAVIGTGCGTEEDPLLYPDGSAEQTEPLDIQGKDEYHQVVAGTARGKRQALLETSCRNVDGRNQAELTFSVIASQPNAVISVYSDSGSFYLDRRDCIPVRERGTSYCRMTESQTGRNGSFQFRWKDIFENHAGFAVRAELGMLQSDIVYLDINNRCPAN